MYSDGNYCIHITYSCEVPTNQEGKYIPHEISKKWCGLNKEEVNELIIDFLGLILDTDNKPKEPELLDIEKLNLYDNEQPWLDKVFDYYKSRWYFYNKIINTLNELDWLQPKLDKDNSSAIFPMPLSALTYGYEDPHVINEYVVITNLDKEVKNGL